MTNTIRFAALVRVSSEAQEKRGESLSTQTNQIEDYVKRQQGIVAEWYKGQEHATPQQEREIFDRLLRDAVNGKWDAVIVTHLDRWARDNRRSKEGFDILRENKKRFFEGMREYDLFSPTDRFQLGISGESAEFFAGLTLEKSIANRIARAKKGYPSGGHLPWGRTFDKKKGEWGVDAEKQALIKGIALRYIDGESMDPLSVEAGMSRPVLWNVLRNRLGDDYSFKIRCDRLNIDTEVAMKIPRLVSPEIEKAVHNRIEANKTFQHGYIKNKYLLSRMIFCADCGYGLTGALHNGYRFYRHLLFTNTQQKPIDCDRSFTYLPADRVEEEVMKILFEMFGDKTKIEKAMNGEIKVSKDERQKLKKDLARDRRALTQVEKQKENLINAVALGALKKDEIQTKIVGLREREESLKEAIGRAEARIKDLPSEREIAEKAKRIKLAMGLKTAQNQSWLRHKDHLAEMTFEDKRDMLGSIFAGKDEHGRRFGIYIKRQGYGSWTFEIRGAFPAVVGSYRNINKIKEVTI